MDACNFASKSRGRCGPNVIPVIGQSLDELDAQSMRIPGKQMKLSWLILSRVGIHFLSSTYGSWVICPNHKKEFLDAWQVPHSCCYPGHISIGQDDGASSADNLVTMVMSVKILQNEGHVVPISGKFCAECLNKYNQKYASKPGEKLVVIVPRTKPTLPVSSSPFCPAAPSSTTAAGQTSTPVPSSQHLPRSATGVLTQATPITTTRPISKENTTCSSSDRPTSPGISIKTELMLDDEEESRPPTADPERPRLGLKLPPSVCRDKTPTSVSVSTVTSTTVEASTSKETSCSNGNQQTKRNYQNGAEKHDEIDAEEDQEVEEDDNESIFSKDSDDDPTWAPAGQDGGENSARRRRDSGDSIDEDLMPAAKKKKLDIKKKRANLFSSSQGKRKPKAKKVKKAAAALSNQTDSDDGDEDLQFDMSEEANRITGAGGNDFHYFCKICQISFYKHTAFKHHVTNSVELHKQVNIQKPRAIENWSNVPLFQIRKKEKLRKDAEMEYECTDCCIAFQDRKSHQNHMVEEHSNTQRNPFYCQKCNVYLKVSCTSLIIVLDFKSSKFLISSLERISV